MMRSTRVSLLKGASVTCSHANKRVKLGCFIYVFLAFDTNECVVEYCSNHVFTTAKVLMGTMSTHTERNTS